MELGALQQLMDDSTVSDILINGHDCIYVEREGGMKRSELTFSSEEELKEVIKNILKPLGRTPSEANPLIDARMPDGSRINVALPPVAIDGTLVSIRKFTQHLGIKDLIKYGSITEGIADFLRICVEGCKNIVISGGTGSGKTTLLNITSSFIPETDRIVTIEDAAELKLHQPHVARLESRHADAGDEKPINIRELVMNALRMRPDRIVVGECRGGEALDMLQAMNTGHDGSLTTLHANNPRDAIKRLETLVLMAGMELPSRAIKEQIASAIHLIIQTARLTDGSRKVTEITEVTGMEGNVITTSPIFKYQKLGRDEDNKIKGKFSPTGVVPTFLKDLREQGIDVNMNNYAQ